MCYVCCAMRGTDRFFWCDNMHLAIPETETAYCAMRCPLLAHASVLLVSRPTHEIADANAMCRIIPNMGCGAKLAAKQAGLLADAKCGADFRSCTSLAWLAIVQGDLQHLEPLLQATGTPRNQIPEPAFWVRIALKI